MPAITSTRAVAQNNNWGSAGSIFVVREDSSFDRVDAQRREKVRRGLSCQDSLGVTRAREVVAVEVVYPNLLEDMVLTSLV